MRKIYHHLLIASALALYLLIVVSGVVRITGSEISCPGWPLCGGSLLPSDGGALLELVNRLLTLVVGVAVVIVALMGWQMRHDEPDTWVWRPPLVAAVLLVGQALINAVALWFDASWLFVVTMVGTQTVMLACLVIPVAAMHVEDHGIGKMMRSANSPNEIEVSQAKTYRMLVLGTMLASWVLVLIGGTVAGTGSGLACVGFPDCNGELLPTTGGIAVFIHMTHRFVAYTVVLLMLWVFIYTAVRRWRDYVLLQWVLLAGALLMTQATLGGANSLLAMPLILRALHLAMAAAYWSSIVIFSLLVLRRPLLSGLDPSGRVIKGSGQSGQSGHSGKVSAAASHSFADH